jgi:spore germination protein
VNVGETLRQIASLHGVGLRTLIDWNGIETPDSLTPGQKLRLTPPTRTYEVKSGDTLNGIAKTLGISRETILEWNPIADPDELTVGQKLVVPS